MPVLILKQGREKSLLRRHPWIFSGAIHHADEDIASGSTVDLLSFNKQFLARASYSPQSQIRARVWTFEDEIIDRNEKILILSAYNSKNKNNGFYRICLSGKGKGIPYSDSLPSQAHPGLKQGSIPREYASLRSP